MTSLEGSRILVTGASGRIGSETCARLTAAGARVTALSDRRRPGLRADRVHLGDTRSERDVANALEGADAVVHLAALAHRDAAPGYKVYSTNVLSTYNVLAQAAERGVRRAVVAGSINRNGIPLGVDEDALPAYFPIDTDLPSDISDWYSLSKFSDEATSRMVWRRWGMDVVTLRFPYVDTREQLVRHAERMAADPAQGLRECWAYLDVRDAARAIELGLVSECRGAMAFYLAADRTCVPYRTDDLLDALAPRARRLRAFAGREVPIDLDAARDLIGFRAQFELDLDERELSLR